MTVLTRFFFFCFEPAFMNTIDQVLVDNDGRFAFDRLPPGDYQFNFLADHGQRSNDYYSGGVKVTIPDEGDPIEFQITGQPGRQAREAQRVK